jgi:hypothetical protein
VESPDDRNDVERLAPEEQTRFTALCGRYGEVGITGLTDEELEDLCALLTTMERPPEPR